MSKSFEPSSKLLKTKSVWSKKKHQRRRINLHRLICISGLSFLLTISSPFIDYFPPYFPSLQVLAQSNNTKKAQADRLLNQGIKQVQTNQFEAALKSWQQALDIYQEIKDRKGEGNALGNLGNIYYSMGDYLNAIEFYERWLKISQEIKDRLVEGYALGNLGNAYHSMGDYPKAIEYHERCLKILQEIKDRQGERNALGNLGLAYESLGDYPKAIEYQKRSLKIAQEIKDRLGEGQSLGNLGNAYRNMGDYPKAIEYLKRSLKIAQEIRNRLGEGQSQGSLGLTYLYLGDYPKAIEYQERYLKIAQEIKDRKGEGQSLGNLGITYLSIGNYPKTIEYHERCLKIFQEIKDRQGKGNTLGNLGLTYLYLGDYPKAIEYQERYLKIAQEIKDRQGEGIALGSLGLTYSRIGDYPKAIGYQQQSLKIAQEIKDRKGEGTALNNLGVAHYKTGNLRNAESTLFDSIKVLESLRGGLIDHNKITIFDTQRKTYNTLQKVLIAQNKTDTALLIAERGRARAFVELLANKLSSNPNEQLLTPPHLNQIKQIASAQNATLVQYSIIREEFKIKGKTQLKESKLYIWVVKPTGEIAFKQVDLTSISQSLKELVISARNSIGVRGSDMFDVAVVTPSQEDPTQKLQQLHKLLIAPIADLLPKNPNERVIFIPQESLFTVPFPALLDDKGKYLVEKHTILTAPSIQVLDFTRQQKLRNSKLEGKNALVVGNPTMPKIELGDLKMNLSALPGSEKEANTVAKLLNTEALIGNKASKATVIEKMQNAGTIHLATHGLLQDFKGFGVPGAIVLAADSTPSRNDGINGLLTASEILDMKLRADLVVLSACDTGRGKITGDGVIGLSRSLISAGVPSVIVSLWKVNDNSTEFLMSEFYRNLRQNPDKAVALRQAMLTTMKQQQYSNPLRWAAFTLIGEAK